MRHLVLLALSFAIPASAAEKRLYISSFERLRVEGPYAVNVTTGRTPNGALSGDAAALAGVEVHQEGETVVVRRADPTERGAPARGVVTVTLSTPVLAAASVIGASEVTVAGMKAARVDLSVAGTGSLAVTGADATELDATSIGDGHIDIAGRAGTARLIANGAGGIGADGLDAGELFVRLDGPGAIDARARYVAQVSNGGLGRVTVAGKPKCTSRGTGSGPVTCGVALPSQ